MMREVRVVRTDTGASVGTRVAVAESFGHRLRGLLAQPPLHTGQGLLLLNCNSVHTVGMSYAIDVAFLDANGRVIRSIAGLRPYRFGLGGAQAAHTLELPAGRLSETGTVTGVRLSWS